MAWRISETAQALDWVRNSKSSKGAFLLALIYSQWRFQPFTHSSIVAFFGILIGPAVMFTMLVFGLTSVTGVQSYISGIIVGLPLIVLIISTLFTGQKMQTRVVLISSGLYGVLFIVTFLYELIAGFATNCFTSPIIFTYGLVFGCYILMTFLHP